MIAQLHLLDTVRKAHAAIFRQHLSLRHSDGGVHLVLEPRSDATPQRGKLPTSEEKAARKQADELNLVLQQLGALLDDQAEIRHVMRHLAYVEHALAKSGVPVLRTLPLDLLQRALHQLEGLVINWSPEGLAALRSKMAVAIIELERQASAKEAPQELYRSTLPVALDDAANLPTVQEHCDQATLSAVYAALGSAAPAGVDAQPQLAA